MQFNTGYNPEAPNAYRQMHPMADYVGAMDPEAYGHTAPHSPEHGSYAEDSGGTEELRLGVNDIGMSVPMGISAANVAGIYSKIRMGAGNLELQFPTYRQGNRNAQSPGMYGEDQRQALREMQEINEVRFTTHAPFQIMGMMGRDERGNYSLNGSRRDLDELKRAIDFQADLGGGSVVFHSGEFERPMIDMVLDDETGQLNLARDQSGRLLFKESAAQEQDAQFQIMDDRTSAKMETVQKDRLVAYAKWLKADRDHEGEDQDGNPVFIRKGDYVDYEGQKVINPYDKYRGRVPEFNKDTGRFETRMMHFDDFRKEANEYNEWLKNNWKTVMSTDKGWNEDPRWYYKKKYPEESFIGATLETQEGYSRGWSLHLGQESGDIIKNLDKLNKAIEFYKKLDKSIPEEERWKLTMQEGASHRMGIASQLIPSESKSPLQALEEARKDMQRALEYSRQSSSSQEQQADDTRETREHLITPIKRLEKYGVLNYAEAAVHAMERTKNPNDPVVVAIENLFPERFGGHVEELKWIIKKSRERMVDILTKPYVELGVSRNPVDMSEEKYKQGLLQENPHFKSGISRGEAERLAEKHIKATFDTGHLNLWRKYWQPDPKLTKEQNDAEFRRWYLGQVESLAKEGMVGNVHLADNYGDQDEHLSPGQGNAPVKEAMAIIKKYGYDKAITVEPGADASTDLSDFHGLMKTWRLFGSPIYGIGGIGGGPGVPQRWGDIQYSYFGQNQPPRYTFGAYAPSNDWTLWSQVPME
ncbi:sugar phosphate isomerase/epimerase [Candidatus Woesearchaeota archaeon]|nr:sugar phosphate isomerase/epimerase [Candidatus Woesearchaeota archaeon]